MKRLADVSSALAGDRRFHFWTLALIILNGLLMGLETVPQIMARHGEMLFLLNDLIQGLFVLEITIRVLAFWPSPFRFFRDGWNLFDFAVIALSLLPVGGQFATISRLARLLRVTRLVSVSFELRLIVQTMLRSIPSMGHVSLLLGLLIYIYGIVGFYLFGATDPAHWGSLGVAMLSVFQLLTLEGWVEMQRVLIPVHPWAWLYFGSFVVVGVFIVINLFIAIVLNNLERVRAEERLAGSSTESLQRAVLELKEQLARFDGMLESEKRRASNASQGGS
ncbi:MAG: ion transporter [Bacteroidota bacterium]